MHLIITATLFIVFSAMSIKKYSTMHSGVLDLGVFQAGAYLAESIGTMVLAFFIHVQLYSLLFIWPYNLLPTGDIKNIFILIIQSLVLALPIFFLRKKTLLVVLAYILYFPLWFNALFDFHFDHIVVLLLTIFFLSVQSNNIRQAFIAAILLSFVKEPFALQTVMCGVYLILEGRGRRCGISSTNYKILLPGSGLIVFGLIYFYIVTTWFIPYALDETMVTSEVFGNSWLGKDVGGILWYIITHPIEIIIEVFTNQGKIIYVVALFGALGFIPLLKPGPLLVALPVLVISLLSQNEGYYGLGNHYTAGLIAPIIFAFEGGVARAKVIWQRVGFYNKWFVPVLTIGLITAHVALAPSPIGRLFWSDKVWSYSYHAYILTERDVMIKQAITDFVPTDPEVVVSIQNTVNLAPLVQRQHFLLFPQGITEGAKVPLFDKKLWPLEIEWKYVMADFLVLDLKRPWFLVDKGCGWLYGKCTNNEVAAEYLAWVVKSRRVMDVIFEEDGFLILQKKEIL